MEDYEFYYKAFACMSLPLIAAGVAVIIENCLGRYQIITNRIKKLKPLYDEQLIKTKPNIINLNRLERFVEENEIRN